MLKEMLKSNFSAIGEKLLEMVFIWGTMK